MPATTDQLVRAIVDVEPNMDRIRDLIQQGADVNGIDSEHGRTPLFATATSYYKANSGREGVATLLLEGGADANLMNPLHSVQVRMDTVIL